MLLANKELLLNAYNGKKEGMLSRSKIKYL